MTFNPIRLVASFFLSIGLALVAPMSAHATVVTLSGATVDYTFDDSLLGLFGSVSISGDTLTFSPSPTFAAESLNGAGVDFVGQTVNFLATPHAGWQFSNVGFFEEGTYTLLGEGVFVAVGGQLRIFDPANPLVELTPLIEADSLLTGIGSNQPWQSTISQNVSILSAAASLNITIENLLLANSLLDSTTARIGKDEIELTVGTSAVPEGNTMVMCLIGLGLLGWQLRMRKIPIGIQYPR